MTKPIVFRRSVLAGILLTLFFKDTLASSIFRQSSTLSGISQWGLVDTRIPITCNLHTLALLRGGQVNEADVKEDEEGE